MKRIQAIFSDFFGHFKTHLINCRLLQPIHEIKLLKSKYFYHIDQHKCK